MDKTFTTFLVFISITAINAHNGSDLERLNERLASLESQVQAQGSKIRQLERQVTVQKVQLQSNEKSLKKCEQMNNNSLSHHLERRAPGTAKVAFSSYMDHVEHHVNLEQIIRFNKVILNDGGAYNNITGIFTVPVSGVYLFTYSVNTWVSSWQLVVKLVLDNENMSDGISDPFHDLQEVQGGNTVMFYAKAGQSVWIAVYNTDDVVVDGREDHRFTTFSGILLYQR